MECETDGRFSGVNSQPDAEDLFPWNNPDSRDFLTHSQDIEIISPQPTTPVPDFPMHDPTPPTQPYVSPTAIVASPPPTSSSTDSASFRLAAKNIFCTWPKCNTDKATVMNNIVATFLNSLLFAIVCHEQHSNGDDHLHAVISFKNKVNFRSTAKLDALASKHGNYRACRNLSDSVRYVVKDNDFVCVPLSFDPADYLAKTKTHKAARSSVLAESIVGGQSLRDAILSDPAFALLHLKQIKAFYAEMDSINMEKKLTGYKEITWRVGWPKCVLDIGIWLNANLSIGNPSLHRPLGKPQLYIHGRTAMGKTHLITQLSTMVKTYCCTSSEHFFDGLDATYNLIVFDEFHGQQTATFMNQILDGQPMVIPQKGCQYFKKNNPPVIILSNYPPHECYPNLYNDHRDAYDAFLRRLVVVELTTRLDLWPPN